jgi:hypothetical protein
MTPSTRQQASAAANDDRQRAAEQEIVIEFLRTDQEEPRSRAELERRLSHVDPLMLGDALERLQRREIVRVDGETVEVRDVEERREKVELLAAVVKYDLIAASPGALSVDELARKAERDPAKAKELEEVELALRLLVVDGLACRRESRWAASRPAIRSEHLSF